MPRLERASSLGIAASPTLLVACGAPAIGGAGNGIQWVGVMTAVQQLTTPEYQARVISLLEALAKAIAAYCGNLFDTRIGRQGLGRWRP